MPVTGEPTAPPEAHAQSAEAALASILRSDEFSGADRLKEFLQYVIAKDLSGQRKAIKAKTIAIDVYRRSTGDADAENLVRVDAGRLRRRLEVYYAGSGQHDPLRIHIDKGGYAPRYTSHQTAPSQSAAPIPGPIPAPMPAEKIGCADLPRPLKAIVFAAGMSVPVSAVLLVWAFQVAGNDATVPMSTTTVSETDRELLVRREILFNEAPERLQALNLVEQGLTMLLPAPDPIRTQAGLILFERAQLLDPSYAGGPAGIALASGIRAGLSPPGETRRASLDHMRTSAERAMRLDATHPLSLTSLAFYDFLAGDYSTAKDRLTRALEIAPDSGPVRDYYSIAALFAGDFETALDVTDPAGFRHDPNRRGVVHNARATAMLLTGEPEQAVDILILSATTGNPISVINHAVLAAAYQASGDYRKARSTRDRMKRAWPDIDEAQLLTWLFYEQADAMVIISLLEEIG